MRLQSTDTDTKLQQRMYRELLTLGISLKFTVVTMALVLGLFAWAEAAFAIVQAERHFFGLKIITKQLLDVAILWLLLTGGLLFILSLVTSMILNANLAKSIRKQGHLMSPQSIGPLLDLTIVAQPREVIVLLSRLLMTLKAGSTVPLSQPQRRALYLALSGRHTLLAHAALHGVTQLEEAAAIPFVERLAHHSSKPLRTAAEDSLRHLYAHRNASSSD